ncbi:MAG: glycosyl transferase family 1, partial [bacterium]
MNRTPSLKGYKDVAPPGAIERLQRLADRVRGRSMVHVNSTRVGGGVVEMLERYVPLFGELELKPRWEVLNGSTEFFRITKTFHNALQGQEHAFTDEMLQTYIETNRANASALDLDADVVFIHDPQPAAMIDFAPRLGAWVWRC